MSNTYLVTLATGQQGRATISALLAAGAKVHAIVRDPSKPAAPDLADQGAVLFRASSDDDDDLAAFRAAAKGCKGLFLNVLSWPGNPDPAGQARGILEACRDAGVEHVVVSTSGWAGSSEKWDIPPNHAGGNWLGGYNRHEKAVEDAVRSFCSDESDAGGARAGRGRTMTYTILRPFWFCSNYLPPAARVLYPGLFAGAGAGAGSELVHSFAPGRALPHVDVPDVGRLAARALSDPATFAGQEIELAAQNLTVGDVAAAIRKVIGREVRVRERTPEEVERDAGAVPWQRWASEVDLRVDVDALGRKYGIRFTTFDEFLVREREKFAECFEKSIG